MKTMLLRNRCRSGCILCLKGVSIFTRIFSRLLPMFLRGTWLGRSVALCAAASAGFMVAPWRESAVARSSRDVFFRAGQQLSLDQPADCGLRRAFRNTDALGDMLIARLHHSFVSALLRGYPHVNEETDQLPVVADQVAHEDINDVVVDFDHRRVAIPADNIAHNS